MNQIQTQLFKRNSLRVAAGLCLLGSMASAHALLMVRTVGVTVNSADIGSYDLDVDLSGTTDFTFQAGFVQDPIGNVGFAQIKLPFASSNAFVVDSNTGDGFPPVSLLQTGDSVSGANMFAFFGDLGELASEFLAPPTGNFFGQTGFVGLRFAAAGGDLYGFAEITVDGPNAANPYSITIGRVGYETAVGQSVVIPGGTGAVPEPGSLALLAAAGIGFLASRRRRPGATA